MSNLSRMQTLAGLSATDQVIAELKASKQRLGEAHDLAIKQAAAGNRIDENLWQKLVAALSTAGQATVMGTKAIAAKAAKLAEPIKQLYLDNKAKLELKALLAGTEDAAKAFEEMADEAPTLLKRDAEVKTAMEAFKAQMQAFISMLTTRGAAIQANESQVNIDETNVTALFEQFLGEEFNAPLAKVKWIDTHMAKIDFQKNRDAIVHALAARLTASDLRKLKDQIEQPVPVANTPKKK